MIRHLLCFRKMLSMYGKKLLCIYNLINNCKRKKRESANILKVGRWRPVLAPPWLHLLPALPTGQTQLEPRAWEAPVSPHQAASRAQRRVWGCQRTAQTPATASMPGDQPVLPPDHRQPGPGCKGSCEVPISPGTWCMTLRVWDRHPSSSLP